jgi:hypothetical protein
MSNQVKDELAGSNPAKRTIFPKKIKENGSPQTIWTQNS